MKTCDEVRALLPLDLTGDLSAAESESVQGHLAGCAGCRADRLELEAVLGRLDSAPVPTASPVDVAGIYSAALDRHARSARRWRRVAIAGAALAAGVLIAAVLPRLELRLGGNELVVRWGPVDPPPAPAPVPPPSPTDPALLARLDALERRSAQPAAADSRLAELQDLLLTLATDVDDRDRRQREELTAAIRQIVLLDAATREQFRKTEQTSAALYSLITDRARPEGGKP